MSFLAIDEIRGKTSGTPTDVNNLKYQLATAWVNFNGTGTVAIRDSYNVSSITDNGVGDYTVNFATAMDNANYSIAMNGDSTEVHLPALTPTTTDFGMRTRNSAGTPSDADYIYANVFGGKN